MFIDQTGAPKTPFGGAERTCELKATFIPPLRMAPEMRHRCSYKDLTPLR